MNDETPVFEQIYGCVSITEFHEIHETVTLLKASDADDPNTPNGKIHFSIISGNSLGNLNDLLTYYITFILILVLLSNNFYIIVKGKFL